MQISKLCTTEFVCLTALFKINRPVAVNSGVNEDFSD